MAENEGNNPEAAGATNANQAEGPQFQVQRIYLKDCSFESPRSPAVFQGQWQPKINFDIKTKNTQIGEGVFEVVLVLTVEATLEEEPGFVVEVHQSGVFTAKDFDAPELEQLLATVCPTILFPYARETIDSLVVKGSFPALMLAPINFDALYTQQKMAAEANANGEAPAPEATN
jgi:preprotein translocase subunit SecB